MADKRTLLFYTALANMAFIVYGSLVPFEIRPHTLAEAWTAFRDIPYLNLGVGSRADWIANIVLYIPFAFFSDAWLASRGRVVGRRPVRVIAVFVTGSVLAVAVEFTQIWFAPRTVSLNDIVAEVIGTVLGISIWEVAGGRIVALARNIVVGGPQAIKAMATFYVLGYLAFSLFPYDFIATPRELAWKLSTGRAHWLWAMCPSGLMCLATLVAEVLAVVPVGAWLAMRSQGDPSRMLRRALYVGLGLGLSMELMQLFLASGVSQGLSVLTRAGGVTLGAYLYQRLGRRQIDGMARYFRPVIVLAVVPYMAAVLGLSGWSSARWSGWEAATARLAQTHFLPFYYHYFSTETVALLSVVRQVALYLPIGIAYWAWWWKAPNGPVSRRVWQAAGMAAALAALVDFGKLFVPDKQPDPTDVGIAAAAAALGYLAGVWVRRWSGGPPAEAGAGGLAPAVAPSRAGGEPVLHPASARVVGAALITVMVAIFVARYPIHPAWLGLGLLAYAALLWRRPSWWLLVLPALLPVLNFSPWTGWFFFNEFDQFVLVTLVVGLLRLKEPPKFVMLPVVKLIIGLFAASILISLLIGLLPLSPLDDNAFSTYMSHYNALRAAKGFLWALALLPLLRRAAPNAGGSPAVLFFTGMVLGLSGVMGAVLWERFWYVGLLNFHSAYRVTATFFSMHTGGPQIEAYLVFALPFAMAWAVARRTRRSFMIACVLAIGVIYGVLVTFSRGGYLGLLVMMTILACSAFGGIAWRRPPFAGRTAVFAGSVLVTMLVAVPVLHGGFAEARLSRTNVDLSGRLQHWRSALAMMDRRPLTTLFGMGLGRFPVTYRDGNTRGEMPGNFAFMNENGNGYLRLGVGDPLYLGQRVDVVDHRDYLLSLDMRSGLGRGALRVSLCEKFLLYSVNCRQVIVEGPDAAAAWVHYSIPVNSDYIGMRIHGLRRSVELAFSNFTADTAIDVDNVRLLDEQGHDLIRNGDFAHGHDRWFFTTDDAIPWRVENVWLQIFFEQGLVGLLAFALLVVTVLLILLREMRLGRAGAPMLFASLAGFLAVGLFGSVLESSRLMLLFYLVLFTLLLASRSGLPWIFGRADKRTASG